VIQPVSYAELHSPDLGATAEFFQAVFGWELQTFADPGYLVAMGGGSPGIDTGLLASRDGQPRVIPVIRVPDLASAMSATVAHRGVVVVEPFTIVGVGRGCYITDPAGLLVGLHQYDSDAR
jgi:predicted enzyme related to lactoylglutathione lyase